MVLSLFIGQFIISLLLFPILFFGIGFLLNMLLKTTWLPVIIYPLVLIALLYFSGRGITDLHVADISILISGLIGALGSGLTIKWLRAKGYRMF